MKAGGSRAVLSGIRSLATTVISVLAMAPVVACATAPEARTALASAEGWATTLAPHRAVYDMTLKTVERGVDIVDVKGRMAIAFSRDCKNWTLNQLSRLTLAYDTGAPVTSDLTFESVESFDGLDFRFQYGDYRDARPVEIADGTVQRNSVGEAAYALFRLPPGRSETLPPDTLFPTVHTIRLLDAAQKGENWGRHWVYTGAGLDSLTLVTAFIHKLEASDVETWPAGADPTLKQDQVWSMRLAFFTPTAGDSAPDYEIDYQIQLNGIVRGFILDYGDFSIRSTLVEIEPIEAPACR